MFTPAHTPKTFVTGRRLFAGAIAAIGEHVPNVYALVFGLVRVATVVIGATHVRDLPMPIALLLAAGVAGVTLEMERRLAVRLNAPIAPAQSYPAILVSWLPPLAVVMTLNSLAAFSVDIGALAAARTDATYRTYWLAQKGRVDGWVIDVRRASSVAAAAALRDVEGEQARIAAARRERAPYSTADLAAARRRLNAARALVRQVSAIPPLPVEPSNDSARRRAEIDRAFRALTDAYVAAGEIARVGAPPAPEAFAPPDVDAIALFINETRRRTPRALGAWISAFVLELLGFTSLFLGGRRTPMGARIGDWKARFNAMAIAARRGSAEPDDERPASPLEVIVEPMGLGGVVYLRGLAEQPASAVWPQIGEAIARHPRVGRHRLFALRTRDGVPIDDEAPLAGQLRGGPLVIVLQPAEKAA